MAAAYNDWIEDRWLGADPRYRGTIAVASQDPQAAAAEVRRCAERNDRWVGVMLSLQNAMIYARYLRSGRWVPIRCFRVQSRQE